jgi:outer membrane protein assembly factor BamA
VPLELHWHLLALPERLVELAFVPVAVTVSVIERYRLDLRLYDLLRNDAGTIFLVPEIKLSGGDGFGYGATLRLRELLGSEDRLELGGLHRINNDHELSVRYRRSIAALDGRELDLRVDYEVDRDARYYGIGNDTAVEHRRALRSDAASVRAALDLYPRGSRDLTGGAELALRRETLAAGTDPSDPAVGEPGDEVAPPPGFDRALSYPALRIGLTYDTRDNLGRPTRGVVAEVGGTVTTALEDRTQNAVAGGATITGLYPLLPRERVLAITAGVAAAHALTVDGEVPLHQLVTLGRGQFLRGYDKQRFRDELGWWGSLEYRYPIYEYTTTRVALAPTLFFDVGRVGSSVDEVFTGPVRWSGGVGLRGAHEILLLFLVELGISPEGPELNLSIGKAL